MREADVQARLIQLLERSEAELIRGGARDVDNARARLENVVELFPDLVAALAVPSPARRGVLAATQARVARCAVLLESTGAFHRGLAIRTQQAGTFYTPGGGETGRSEPGSTIACEG